MHADIQSSTDTKNLLHEPPMFRVIYLNDNHTPIDFVINSLINWFQHSQPSAQDLSVSIHEQGAAVVAVLPYEIAEQKGIEVTNAARNEGFPLQIKLEPDRQAD